MSIEICNLRKQKPTQPYDVRVDRQSVLGNPFFMKDESQRDSVCDKYKIYFIEQMKDKTSAFYKEVQRLIQIYKQYDKLKLFCWCFPHRCHAETIRDYILEVCG